MDKEPVLGALIQEVLSQCDFNAQEHGAGEISWVMRDPLARLGQNLVDSNFLCNYS